MEISSAFARMTKSHPCFRLLTNTSNSSSLTLNMRALILVVSSLPITSTNGHTTTMMLRCPGRAMCDDIPPRMSNAVSSRPMSITVPGSKAATPPLDWRPLIATCRAACLRHLRHQPTLLRAAQAPSSSSCLMREYHQEDGAPRNGPTMNEATSACESCWRRLDSGAQPIMLTGSRGASCRPRSQVSTKPSRKKTF